jgi:hypothetical protein
MALRRPRPLPKKFARQFSPATRRLAERSCFIAERSQRKRSEAWTRLKKRTAKLWLFFLGESKFWLMFGVIVLSVTTISTLLFAPFFNVRSIRVERENASIDAEEIQRTLLPLFDQKLLLVTRAQVQEFIQPLYPDSTWIDIRKEYPSTLIVHIDLEEPVAHLQIEEGEQESGTGAHVRTSYTYITANGYFLESPLQLKEGLPIPTLTIVDWAVRPKNHTKLLPKEFLDTIESARTILKRDFNLEPKKIVVYIRAQEFHIVTPKGTLWFDQKSPLSVSFDRLRQFLRTISFAKIKEYVDLRIEGAVVYK